MPDSLSAALATLRSRYGPQALRQGGSPEEPGTWPTLVPVLDGVLTPGGLPRGRVTVLAAAGRGPSGRLTLLQSLVALASRSHDTGYVDLAGSLDPGFLADLGADLSACLVISPGPERWERGLVMARSLVTAGMPWVGIALGWEQPRPALWDHALAALAEGRQAWGDLRHRHAGPGRAPDSSCLLAHARLHHRRLAARQWRRIGTPGAARDRQEQARRARRRGDRAASLSASVRHRRGARAAERDRAARAAGCRAGAGRGGRGGSGLRCASSVPATRISD
jgi:hypothetical protein